MTTPTRAFPSTATSPLALTRLGLGAGLGLRSVLGIGLGIGIGLTCLTPALGLANSSGPLDGRAGDPPAFETCNDAFCHNSFDLNSGDGTLAIAGLPESYEPGAVYALEVMITHPDQERWGFQTTVIDAAGDQAGDLVPVDPTLVQVSEGAGPLRDYAKHRSAGTFRGQPDGATWELLWTAPDAGTGTASFYLAGNAANDNAASSGDYIYTFATDIPEGDVSGIEDGLLAQSAIALSVFPQPVRSDATIRLQLPQESSARVVLVDLLGREVRELASGTLAAGEHHIHWDGLDDLGRSVPAGVYYSVFTSAGVRKSGSVVVVR